mgnify:CR=1 FL=1
MINGTRFKVGDVVNTVAFTDCFGKYQPEVKGLTIASCTTVEGFAPHFRVKAVNLDNPFRWFEGAERFFEHDR